MRGPGLDRLPLKGSHFLNVTLHAKKGGVNQDLAILPKAVQRVKVLRRFRTCGLRILQNSRLQGVDLRFIFRRFTVHGPKQVMFELTTREIPCVFFEVPFFFGGGGWRKGTQIPKKDARPHLTRPLSCFIPGGSLCR